MFGLHCVVTVSEVDTGQPRLDFEQMYQSCSATGSRTVSHRRHNTEFRNEVCKFTCTLGVVFSAVVYLLSYYTITQNLTS